MDNNYNPYEDFDEIIDPSYRKMMNEEDENGLIIGDPYLSEEEAETGTIIVTAFASLALVAIITLAIYLLH